VAEAAVGPASGPRPRSPLSTACATLASMSARAACASTTPPGRPASPLPGSHAPGRSHRQLPVPQPWASRHGGAGSPAGGAASRAVPGGSAWSGGGHASSRPRFATCRAPSLGEARPATWRRKTRAGALAERRWTPGSALLTTSGGTSLLRTSPSRNLYPFDCCTDPVNPTSHLVGSGAQHPSSLIHLKPGHRPRPIPPAGMEMRDITVTPLNMAMVDEVRARRVLATLAARLRGSLSTPFKGAPPGATRTTSAQDHALAHITGEATSILSRAPNNVRRPDTAAV